MRAWSSVSPAAPETGIVSLYPTTVVDPGCTTGYTNCPDRLADGTSFASPLAASAAAVLLGEGRGAAVHIRRHA